MRADPPSALMPAVASRSPRVGNAAAVVLILVVVLALYFRTTLSMVSIWQRSETFTHGFVVIPIFVWLVWRQRNLLATIPPEPGPWALAGIVGAGVVWLIGELVSAAVVSQFAMVAMVPLAAWALLGTRVVAALGIPLAFLFFAVPFGDFLVPMLTDRTADVAIAAIRASGVPVYREGNYFTIPTGRWSVVEACSGIRYLIASLMVGSLFAYLSYRSTGRRLAFIAASCVVPIIANWIRAYMIVMLGHLTNNRLAVGADHLIYGWVFFGIVMALLFWIGARWREDEDPMPAPPAVAPVSGTVTAPPRRMAVIAIAALALVAVWPLADAMLAREPATAAVTLEPLAGRDGWQVTPEPFSTWRPDVGGARAELREAFAKDSQRVMLHVALFRDQTPEAKAVTTQNQLVRTENPRWKRVADGALAVGGGAHPLEVRTAVVTDDRERLVAFQWFWVDGRATANAYAAKLYQALAVLRGRGDATAWVVVYAPAWNGDGPARQALEAFVADMREPIEAALTKAATR